MTLSRKKTVAILTALIRYAEKQTCLHEETYHGGAIWEICGHCGMKWADDEGGKPADAHDLPKEIEDAYKLLTRIEGKPKGE